MTLQRTLRRATWYGAGRLLLVEVLLAPVLGALLSSHGALRVYSGPVMGPFLIADALSEFHRVGGQWAMSTGEIRPFVHRFPSHPAYVFSFVRLNSEETGAEYVISFNDVLQTYRFSPDGHAEAIGPAVSAQIIGSKER